MKKDKYSLRVCKTKDDEYYLKRKRNNIFGIWGDLYVGLSGSNKKHYILSCRREVLLSFLDRYNPFKYKDIILNSNEWDKGVFKGKLNGKCEEKL